MLAALAAVVLGQPATARVGVGADGSLLSPCIDRRPPAEQRLFISAAVDAAIERTPHRSSNPLADGSLV